MLSKNQEPSSKRVRALVTDSAQDDFAADLAQIDDNLTECHEESDPDFVNDNVGLEMLLSKKEKFREAESFRYKIFWLTVTPRSWKVSRLMNKFHISYRLAKRAKDTQNQTGFGSYPSPRQSNTMQSEYTQRFIDFYESYEISRVMPGMSDALSVAQANGKRLKLQKRLILCHSKEAYASFKVEFPSIKGDLSKFANTRPKQCVLADSSGTHTVCVCKAHQNFKLM
ncbi:hypothetical protein QAD02_008299 [Eretmocerus hayati]|uniref:Uncharacterized protein n=1 Tax=Eretmocerus hayati TaxID=131215 RepID=A0ACC2N6E1_9HYME|nr:hypothetical protein QAD02_008299 [Eretmocerus hayati]